MFACSSLLAPPLPLRPPMSQHCLTTLHAKTSIGYPRAVNGPTLLATSSSCSTHIHSPSPCNGGTISDMDRLTREWEGRRTSVLQTKHSGGLAAAIKRSLAPPMLQGLGRDTRATNLSRCLYHSGIISLPRIQGPPYSPVQPSNATSPGCYSNWVAMNYVGRREGRAPVIDEDSGDV